MRQASYLHLHESGELERRAQALEALSQPCHLCPRHCEARRLDGDRGECGCADRASLVSCGPHHGEEPCLSGWRGSGTLFFGHCNLRCDFCQNHDISQCHRLARQMEVDPPAIAAAMLRLQEMGCHNINWVSPSHCVAPIVRALVMAAQAGLRLPIVYNSNGYDSLETLRLLDGVVDIHMPDLKYAHEETAEGTSHAPHYVDSARVAIREMHRQVGDLEVDDRGIAVRGLLLRHLVLPHDLSGTRETLTWIRETLGENVTVNLMAQYHPAHRAHRDPRLARCLHASEYQAAVDCAEGLGLRNVMTQPVFV